MAPKHLTVAVNARFLLKDRLEGIGRFSHEVLRQMALSHSETKFVFFFDRPYDPSFIYAPNVEGRVLFPPARHAVLFVAWFEFSLANALNKLKPDVFFSPDGYLSLRARTKQVAVFHDLAFEHFPQDISWFNRTHYQTFFPRYARRADRLLTVSEYTRQDIVKQYGVLPEKIDVVYNGYSSVFRPSSEQEKTETRAKYANGQPYFMYAGAIQPRKNLDRLLAAFDAFKAQTGSPAKLVLTGRKAWQFEKVVETYQKMRFRDDVLFTGFVSDEDLNKLYGASLGLCYVSRFEGFGIPILEAMAAETAVISSNTSSMPEVYGEAALPVDPYKTDEIKEALVALWENNALRQTLIEKGRTQKLKFSWENSAGNCWAGIEQAVRGE